MNANKSRNDEKGAPTKERRRHRRATPIRPLSIQLPDGTVRNNIVADISVGGLRLKCDPEAAVIIRPPGEPAASDDAPRVKVRISFMVDGSDELVTATCKYCYIKGSDTEVTEVGVQFEGFEEGTPELFRQFVEESLMSSEKAKKK